MIFSYFNKKLYLNSLIVILIFFFDRISKILIINLHKENFGAQLYTSSYLNIKLIWNEGIAFGLLSFNENYIYNFLTLFIAGVILIIFILILKNEGYKRLGLLLIMGGALGNLYDRIFYKAVPDFLDLHIGNFHWFIFNIADIFITAGVIFMILVEYIDNNKNIKNEQN